MTITAHFDLDAYSCFDQTGDGVMLTVNYTVKSVFGKVVINFTNIAFGPSYLSYLNRLAVNIKQWEKRVLYYGSESIFDDGLAGAGMTLAHLAAEGISESDFSAALTKALQHESSIR